MEHSLIKIFSMWRQGFDYSIFHDGRCYMYAQLYLVGGTGFPGNLAVRRLFRSRDTNKGNTTSA